MPNEIQTPSRNAFTTILVIGLVAGTLDIATALLLFPGEPIRLFQIIASGAFGRDAALAGGITMAAWGFFFHYFIAFTWTIIYFFLYPKISILQKNRLISGLVYGIVVWIGMNLIVLPLSKINQQPFAWVSVLRGMGVLMVMVGLPIAVLTHRYYNSKVVSREVSR